MPSDPLKSNLLMVKAIKYNPGTADGALLAALAPARRGTELSRQLKIQLLQDRVAARGA